MHEKELFFALVDTDVLYKSDAIILLEGDGFNRLDKCVELFDSQYAPVVVISGGVDNYQCGSFPASKMKEELLAKHVPESSIILESKSTNTREQSLEVISLAKLHDWKSIIIVASHYHQYRAYLTFLQAMQEFKIDLIIMNAPATKISWFFETPWGVRSELFYSEMNKIEQYRQLGHIASYEFAINYQRIKEKKIYDI